MKKLSRLLMIAALVMLCVVLLPAEAKAETVASGYCGGNLTWKLDEEGTLTISGTGEMEDYGNFGWNEILDKGIVYDESPWRGETIKKIVIEAGVQSIGDYAFFDCLSVTTVVIPDSVASIGEGAFSRCVSLESVIIGSGVRDMEKWAFSGCRSLTEVEIKNGLKYINQGAFSSCTALKSVAIPDSVTAIHGSAFDGCSELETVSMGKNVASIGDYAFYSCVRLENLVLGESVVEISYNAFTSCTNLKSVVIPDTVKTVGTDAFKDTAIEKVFYAGTGEEWSGIDISGGNIQLTDAEITYNYLAPEVDLPDITEPTKPEVPAEDTEESGGFFATIAKFFEELFRILFFFLYL